MADEKDTQDVTPAGDAPQTSDAPKEEVKAPVSEICGNAQENAVAAVGDDSEIKPVEGFFLTSQRWH